MDFKPLHAAIAHHDQVLARTWQKLRERLAENRKDTHDLLMRAMKLAINTANEHGHNCEIGVFANLALIGYARMLEKIAEWEDEDAAQDKP